MTPTTFGTVGAGPLSSERAVSDVIGFTLMFGIIIVGVAVVSVGGLDDVLAFGDREELQTGERGMEAAASTLDKINSQSDWNRSFSVVVGTGTIWMNSTEMTVSGPADIESAIGDSSGTIPINALEHRFDRYPEDISVQYEAGGVFRSDGIAAHYRPSFKCNGDSSTAIVSIVNMTDGGSGINVGVGYRRQWAIDPTSVPDESPVAPFAETLTLQADFKGSDVYTNRAAGSPLRIDVSGTTNPDTWEYYLENEGWAEAGPGTYECDADTVVVRVMTVSFRRLI